MQVEYKKAPGRNWGLHIEGASLALRDKLVAFVSYNSQWMTAPHYDECHRASPFIQSDSYGGPRESKRKEDPNSYLFIEFWSPMTKHAEFLKLMMADAGIATSHPEVHADIYD